MPRPAKEKKLVSTSALARETGLDRATVRERLQKGNVEPKEEKAKEKLYDPEEALTALQAEGTSGLRKAQTMKTAVEANRAKLKLDKERGQLVPIQDVRDGIQTIVSEIRLHFLTRAQVLAPQLRGQKVARIEALLREDAEQFFTDLRAQHEGYLGEQAD